MAGFALVTRAASGGGSDGYEMMRSDRNGNRTVSTLWTGSLPHHTHGGGRPVFIGFGVAAIAVTLAASTMLLGWIPAASPDRVIDLVRSWGPWGALASIALMVAHSFVPFPAEVLAAANGLVYGPIWGTLVTWIGAMIGAWAAFGAARMFGRPVVERILPEKHRRMLDRWTATQSGVLLLAVRFVPIVAFNLVNYAAGLARVPWWTFTWTTGLGILPLTALMVGLGNRLPSVGWEVWAAGLGAGLVAWLALRRSVRHAMAEAVRTALDRAAFHCARAACSDRRTIHGGHPFCARDELCPMRRQNPRTLAIMSGVRQVQPVLSSRRVHVRYSASELTTRQIRSALEAAGFGPALEQPSGWI